MNENIYQSPEAELDSLEERKGSPIKAVVIATAVDIIGTMILSVVLAIAYSAYLAANGMSPEAIAESLQNVDTWSPFSLVGIFLGCIITVYAGYLCAKIVNYSEYKIATVFGIITTLFGIVMTMSYYSLVENIAFSLLTMACVYLGTWMHLRKKTSQ